MLGLGFELGSSTILYRSADDYSDIRCLVFALSTQRLQIIITQWLNFAFSNVPAGFVFSDLAVRGAPIRAEVRDELLEREQAGAHEAGAGR